MGGIDAIRQRTRDLGIGATREGKTTHRQIQGSSEHGGPVKQSILAISGFRGGRGE